MQITHNFLNKNFARDTIKKAWQDYKLQSLDVLECIEKLKAEQENIKNKYNENSLLWCTWLLPHCMEPDDIMKYTKFCARWADNPNAVIADAMKWPKFLYRDTIRASAWAWDAAKSVPGHADKISLQIINYGIKLIKQSSAKQLTLDVR